MIRKMHFGKADRLILANGSSEHTYLFCVAISRGSKTNFRLCEDMKRTLVFLAEPATY